MGADGTVVGRRVRVGHGVAPWLRVCAAIFAVAWAGNQFTPLLVMYRQRDHLSSLTVDGLLGVYVLGIAPAMILGAPLSYRYGRGRVMLPAPFLAAAGGVVLALAHGDLIALAAGRVACGVALGLVMAVGTSWVKELSQPPFAPSRMGVGASRGTLSLTAGFVLGAVVAAGLAQYAPAPQMLPYAVDIALAIGAGVLAFTAPETRPRLAGRGGLRTVAADLRVRTALRRRFLLVVLPSAPWIFGTAGSAYAVLPALLGRRVPAHEVAFSGLLCLIALGVGFVVQPLARRLHHERSARAVVVALATTVVGMAATVAATATLSIPLALMAAAVLGAGTGLLMLSGLLEVQRIATDRDLAGLTALFYAAAYTGFFVPALLAALAAWVPYPVLFAAGALLAAGCTATAWLTGRSTPRRRPALAREKNAA